MLWKFFDSLVEDDLAIWSSGNIDGGGTAGPAIAWIPRVGAVIGYFSWGPCIHLITNQPSCYLIVALSLG